MRLSTFEQLFAKGLISEHSFTKAKERINAPRNIITELRLILYAGILMLSGGLGVLVYENIHSISHLAIVLCLAIVFIASFMYCFMKADSFTVKKVKDPNVYFSYVLLLGCLSFITLVGYLQYQYTLFGTHYGMATLVPMLVLFFAAYRFDHLGVLSLALVNACAFAGLTVAPTQILNSNDWSSPNIILTSVAVSVIFTLCGIVFYRRSIKEHFRFTYYHFALHLFGLSAVSVIFSWNYKFLWVCILLVGAWVFYQISKKLFSYFLLLLTVMYTYIGFSIWMLYMIAEIDQMSLMPIYLIIFYIIASAIIVARFLMITYKKMNHDGL